MRRLAEAWPAPTFVPQAVAQMPWGHLRVLLDKIEEPAARDCYVHQCVAGGWSRNVLLNQIKGRAHARAAAAPCSSIPRNRYIIGSEEQGGVMSVASESSQAYDLIERIEILERIADTLPDEDDRRLALIGLVEKDLASAHPFRPRIAAYERSVLGEVPRAEVMRP
jgi:DUF1016 N-terminal domain